MKKILSNLTFYPIWVALVGLIFNLWNTYSSQFPNVKSEYVITVALFIIVLDIPFQFSSRINLRADLKKDIQSSFRATDQLVKGHQNVLQNKFETLDRLMKDHFGDITDLIKSDNIGVITEIEQTKVFRNFVGDVYYAYNSPMEYELEKIDERMDFHVKRYSDPKFKMAHYYYSIFSSSDKNIVKEWMEGVYAFYSKLSNDERLTLEQKMKLTFYVPDKDVIYSSNFEITYFIGKTFSAGRQERDEAVVYVHNDIFMELDTRRPKVMFIIYRENLIRMLLQHRKATTNNMIAIQGIDNFLEYLKKKLCFYYV